MCTFGIKLTDKRRYIFKNLDVHKVIFSYSLPIIDKNVLKFYIPGKNGIWTGINRKGLLIQTAEHTGNLISKCKINTWPIFERMLEHCNDTYSGLAFLMSRFKEAKMDLPGSILLSDRNTSIIAEYYPSVWGIKIIDDCDARAGIFGVLTSFNKKPKPDRAHLAVRLMSKIKDKNAVDSLKALCRKHNMKNSICRHKGPNTNGSIIMDISEKAAIIHYVLNSHPCKSEYKRIVFELY
ncbi:MAG: hypothetical protein PHO02_03445 [Candidatus Nanoarchaeia archaeon]|nr:hypothetical protein [Candidatus Nanoarchaeia archaeon]